jgi:hypothetical protein
MQCAHNKNIAPAGLDLKSCVQQCRGFFELLGARAPLPAIYIIAASRFMLYFRLCVACLPLCDSSWWSENRESVFLWLAPPRIIMRAPPDVGASGFAANGPLFRPFRGLSRKHPGTSRNRPGTNPEPSWNQLGSIGSILSRFSSKLGFGTVLKLTGGAAGAGRPEIGPQGI